MIDFGFDEVEYSVPERFERAFGAEAAYHWEFKRRPLGLAGMTRALQRQYNRVLYGQLHAKNLLFGKQFVVPFKSDHYHHHVALDVPRG